MMNLLWLVALTLLVVVMNNEEKKEERFDHIWNEA